MNWTDTDLTTPAPGSQGLPAARPRRVWVLTRAWGGSGDNSLPLAAFASQARADAALALLKHADGTFELTALDLED